ncbi:MAG: type IV toxin-antitoxin system AbiEi family antitoxin [Kineosporiaceae bacterium]
MRDLVEQHGIRSDPKLVALRLRQKGWLLPTGVRGVWEFAPGAHAGPYGHGDPLGGLKAFRLLHPRMPVSVALSTAAWAHGLADRLPTTIEVAVPPHTRVPSSLAAVARVMRFETRLPSVELKGESVHRPESVLVHLAQRPGDIRSWASAVEWLPELAAGVDATLIHEELSGRPPATRSRLGYLLQTLRPDIAARLVPEKANKTWFGPRGPLLRHSQRWQVADTVLPFDPASLAPEGER